MTDLIDRIGPYLGVAAFLGLAILAFLIIQQAREVRRLREWAGRAPERATEATEAEVAVAEAKGEEPEAEEVEAPPPEPDRRMVRCPPRLGLRSLRRARPAVAGRSPLPGRAARRGRDRRGGADQRLRPDRRRRRRRRQHQGGKDGGGKPKEEKVEVAVLNATQEEAADGTEIAGVQGLADVVAKQVVQPLDGFAVGEKTNADSGFDQTTVMFEPDGRGGRRRARRRGRRPARRAGGDADDRRGPRPLRRARRWRSSSAGTTPTSVPSGHARGRRRDLRHGRRLHRARRGARADPAPAALSLAAPRRQAAARLARPTPITPPRT